MNSHNNRMQSDFGKLRLPQPLMRSVLFTGDKPMRKIVVVALINFVSGCIVLPATRDGENSDCELVTREMYVDVHELGSFDPDADAVAEILVNAEGVLVFVAVSSVIFSVSWIVSSSIVLVGNTIHWIETKGKCNARADDIVAVDVTDSFACNVKSGQCTILK